MAITIRSSHLRGRMAGLEVHARSLLDDCRYVQRLTREADAARDEVAGDFPDTACHLAEKHDADSWAVYERMKRKADRIRELLDEVEATLPQTVFPVG